MFHLRVALVACVLVTLTSGSLRAQQVRVSAEFLVLDGVEKSPPKRLPPAEPASAQVNPRAASQEGSVSSLSLIADIETLTKLRESFQLVQHQFLAGNVRPDESFELLQTQGRRTFKVTGKIVKHKNDRWLAEVRIEVDEVAVDRVLADGRPARRTRFTDLATSLPVGKPMVLGGATRTSKQGDDPKLTYDVFVLRLDEVK